MAQPQNDGVPFVPSPWLRGGHAQTVAAALLPHRLPEHHAVAREVDLGDGDRIVVHDDLPPAWTPDRPVAILSHGLCESHRGALMVRLTESQGPTTLTIILMVQLTEAQGPMTLTIILMVPRLEPNRCPHQTVTLTAAPSTRQLPMRERTISSCSSP